MTKYWHPKKIKDNQGSPGRIYSDQFLYENLEKIISKKEISILDIGCGSGYIRKIFSDLGYRVFYTGVDVKKHKRFDQYSEYSLKNNFIESKIENFQTEKKFDLIFSICALEHIKNDKLAVSKFKSDIQIHIIPSTWSFFLYIKHGYRRYGPSKLKKLFGEPDSLEIYRLGGLFSFVLHFFYITIPKHVFKSTKERNLKTYPKFVRLANNLDPFLPILSSIHVVITKKI